MTKEQLLIKHCGFPSVTEVNGVRVTSNVENAMDEYAKQQAIAFDEWRIENRWFSFEQGYYYHTFEQGTSMSESSYLKKYVKTREQLYDLFIEQQNKP